MFVDHPRNKYYRYCTLKALQKKNPLTKHLIFVGFKCTDSSHCNGHGDCDNEQCDCDNDWSSQPDCSGKISSPSLNRYLMRTIMTGSWLQTAIKY